MTAAVAYKDDFDLTREALFDQDEYQVQSLLLSRRQTDYSILAQWESSLNPKTSFSSIKPRNYFTPMIYLSVCPEDKAIIAEIESSENTSMAILGDIRSEYDKVRATLIDFRLSSRTLLKKDEVLARITELNDLLAEDLEETKLSATSVGACLRFLSQNKDLCHPDIMASPNGTIICQWRKDKSRNLTIEFLSDYNLNYLIFSPSQDGIIRNSGKCGMKDFRQLITPFNTERWTTINEK